MFGKILRNVMASAVQVVARVPGVSRHRRAISLLLEAGARQVSAGDWDAAAGTYRRVLEFAPGNVDALYSLGVVETHRGEHAVARNSLEQAVENDPRHIEALNALGNVMRLQQEWQEAASCYRRALGVDPGHAPALSNLGLCLKAEARFEESVAYLERAYRLRPDDAGIVLNYALGLREVGRDLECEAHLRQAIRLNPDMTDAHTNLATHLLKRGSFREGWLEYEWRMRADDWEPQLKVDCPVWDGSPLDGKVILVRGEQGLGDQIMFASCLPEIIGRAGLCVVEIDQRLKQLFSRSFPRARIYAQRRSGIPGWSAEGIVPDCQAQIGSLPERLDRVSGNFPEHHGCLLPDQGEVQAWQSRLERLGAGLKVGLSWRGGTLQTRQATRSIPLEQWERLLTQRVHWISLQYTDCQEEIGWVERHHGVRIHHWQDAINDYDRTAALVCALDLVITVQTSIVHLGGALGRTPVWVMVPAVAEWRYLQNGERLPWYPAVRLFRQTLRGEWKPVLEYVEKELARVATGQDLRRDPGR